MRVEVRITAQIESILAREMGKRELTEQEREAILSVAGRRLIDECLAGAGPRRPAALPHLPALPRARR